MFNKKICLIMMTLVFMLSVSAVAAADSNSTDDVVAGEVDEEPPSCDVGVLSANEETTTPADANGYSLSANEQTTDSTGNASDSLSASEEASTSVVNHDYSLSGSDVSMYYKGGSSYVVTLYDGKNPVSGSDIKIILNKVTHVLTTNGSGKVSLPIDLSPNTYEVSASFGGISIKNKITVLPVITGKDITKTYRSSTQYTATFVDSKGSPLKNTDVKFILNGKTYTKKTDSKGVASLDIELAAGSYVVYAVHPNGYKISNKVVVKRSVITSNLNKYYKSSKKFTATFYGTDGKVLAKKKVKFKIGGKTYKVKTNKKGKASLTINAKPGTHKITTINTATGERVKNTINVKPTLHAKNIIVFTDKKYKFKVTLYRDEKLSANNKVVVYIKGAKKTAKTNSKGLATVKFKLGKGKYTFKAVDPYTGYSIKRTVTVKLASIDAHSIAAVENQASAFYAKLYGQDGKIAANTKMKITINGVSHKVKTDSKGVAHVDFKFPVGKYKVVCKDLDTGYSVTCQITVAKERMKVSYNKYGVSADGKTILAIGRPSAPGEESKYGYTWYMTEFERTCPYCGSHDLYWDVFWAGNEHDEVGIFPATGRREPGSTEGMIFCDHCDADFSIFGLEHIYSNPKKLTVVYGPVKSSKEAAYLLKSGTYER